MHNHTNRNLSLTWKGPAHNISNYKEPLKEGYYHPHVTDGEAKTQTLLKLTKMVSN